MFDEIMKLTKLSALKTGTLILNSKVLLIYSQIQPEKVKINFF